ncbi:MAG: sigma-54-dependent Fis family transcriptional regulator [Myxococcales bacterium]|nr:sigma-54-dependent Fis family transcriptional regulator [Myxococcales bacterium]MCB9625809.1 sigma-54-dependent Fis family transcriptional regulator [Sandaracinaceae bacterium]
MSPGNVLLIDDDAAFRFAMQKALRRGGFDVMEATDGESALRILASQDAPDVALLDLRMKGIDGLEVLRRRGAVRTRMIVLTGHGTVQAAVEAMRLGAFSFLEKPVDAELLRPLIKQAVAESRRAEVPADESHLPLVGVSEATAEVRKFIATVGPTDETVTIFGETGTGKEVVAQHIHLASLRRDAPFVAMNAACVPRELFESELFGHKRGAFTGASADRLGLFREAHGGTLFIDELAELPIESQAKLLRALETRLVRPVGDSKEHAVDVRIVAATNCDLWAEVQAGNFREDLYFRLQVFPVLLMPLRERTSDILPLAAHLLERLGYRQLTLSEDAQQALVEYHWPGNVRELLNVLRRAALFAEHDELRGDLMRRMIAASVFGHAAPRAMHVPISLSSAQATVPTEPAESTAARPSTPDGAEPGERTSLADVERAHIERVLRQMEGNVTRTATALGIDRRTLQRKLKTYGLGDETD